MIPKVVDGMTSFGYFYLTNICGRRPRGLILAPNLLYSATRPLLKVRLARDLAFSKGKGSV